MSSFFLGERAEMRTFFGLLPLVLVAFIPAITMRLWAEERKLGTIELLMTLPVRTHSVVTAKFLASFVFFLIALAGTWTIPATLSVLGNPDPGVILGGYLGCALLGGFYLSVGIFASALSRDQIVAFIIALVLCYAFYISGSDYVATQLNGWSGSLTLGTVVQNYISLTEHFKGIERGIIALKDIVYFLTMTVLFLLLNIQFLNKSRQVRGKTGFIVVVIVFSAVALFTNIVASGFSSSRLDLTEEKIFTVSPASKKILKQLKAPVMVRYYVTSQTKMPSGMKNIERDVTDKLEELKIASKGRLTFEVADPSMNPALQEEIRKKGVTSFQIQSVERDEVAIKLIYSSLSISYLDKPQWVINPVHSDNIDNLEYELISKIYKLSLDRSPRVLFYTPSESAGSLGPTMEKRPSQMVDKFSKLESLLERERYDVVRMNLDEESGITQNTDTLVIVRPRELNERQRYEINRFLVEGGNVILAVQNYTAHYLGSSSGTVEVMPVSLSPGVNRLIENYGVKVEEKILMDTLQETLSIPASTGIKGLSTSPQSVPVKLPIQVRALPTKNGSSPITEKITALLYVWGSPLIWNKDIIKDTGLKVTELVSSSKESWTIALKKGGILKKTDMAPPINVDGVVGTKPLAVLIEGQFPDLFKGKDVPLWPTQESYAEDSRGKAAAKKGAMILIGNGEMFDNDFLEALGNGIFMLNAVDTLSIGGNIIGIRTRHQSQRFIRSLSPEKKLWYRFFVIFFMPLTVVACGIIRFLIRRRVKAAYMRTLNET